MVRVHAIVIESCYICADIFICGQLGISSGTCHCVLVSAEHSTHIIIIVIGDGDVWRLCTSSTSVSEKCKIFIVNKQIAIESSELLDR